MVTVNEGMGSQRTSVWEGQMLGAGWDQDQGDGKGKEKKKNTKERKKNNICTLKGKGSCVSGTVCQVRTVEQPVVASGSG